MKLVNMGRCQEYECTPGCHSRQHGAQIMAAIIRGTESQAIAYMKNLCQRCHLVTDNSGKTALHTAASCGKNKVVKWLVSQGAPLNQRDWENGYTPLHRAVYHGHLGVALTLIQAGCNTSTLDHDGFTPMDLANFDRPYKQFSAIGKPTHVYVWGNNTNFNLGQANDHGRGTPECLESLQREGKAMFEVVLNKFHTLFMTRCGSVYSCGHGQGGRLGLETDASVITPRLIKVFAHTNVLMVAGGTDHSIFLTESGQVWSCGSNLYHQLGLSPPPKHVYTPRMLSWHKEHKYEKCYGVGAAKYHSVIWTSEKVYTFGLNAGQLGHFKNDNECTIITPRNVTSIVLNDGAYIQCVAVSDGATVVSTACGSIYVLHQYQIRKLSSKMLGVERVACFGGHLDSKVGADGLIESGGDDLKIAVLTNCDHLYLWTEQSSQLSRCIFCPHREISLQDICLSRQYIGIVTRSGEAFLSMPTQSQKSSGKFLLSKSRWRSGPMTEIYNCSSHTTLRLTRIPALHRTVNMKCDAKGLNFAAVQVEPSSNLSSVPQISPSTYNDDFKNLLLNASEMDALHDVVISCGGQRFLAHSFILSSHSPYLYRILIGETEIHYGDDDRKEMERKCFMLSDVDPEAVEQVLTFMYSGSCKRFLSKNDSCDQSFEKELEDMNGNTSDLGEWYPCKNLDQKSAVLVYKEIEDIKTKEKHKKKKGRNSSGRKDCRNLSQSILYLAKKLEMKELIKAMENPMKRASVGEERQRNQIVAWNSWTYRRENLPELWDVRLTSKSGETIGAHRCVLAARLEYFNIMFSSRWMKTEASESLNMSLPTGILTIVLDYLYEDDAPKLRKCRDIEFLCSVLTVADQFLISRLKEICERIMSNLLTLKNAAELLEFAVQYNAEGLKSTTMEFLHHNLAAIMENGSLSSMSSETLEELGTYYRNVTPSMSYRIITPYDAPPYTADLEEALDKNPVTMLVSDEEMEGTYLLKVAGDKTVMTKSARKKKRKHHNSQGDSRLRKYSTSSSVCSSDCDQQKDLEEEFGNMNFDDLEERKQPLDTRSIEVDTKEETSFSLTLNLLKDREDNHAIKSTAGSSSWQKVTRKKSMSGQSLYASVKSSVESPVIENNLSDLSQSVGSLQDLSQGTEMNAKMAVEVPLPKFPSLQDSLTAAQRTSQKGKYSKIQKLSQKQRKKLVAEALAEETHLPDKPKMPSQGCPWGAASPAWGKEQSASDADNDKSHPESLANIMMAEKTRVWQPSVPADAQSSKNLARNRAKRSSSSEGTTASSPEQGLAAWSTVTSPAASPVISKQPITGLYQQEGKITPSDAVSTPSFTHILQEEETHSDNLMRERSKPLSMIQIEDRAIEELLAFYGAAECFEEKITVSRVRASVANPTWSK